MLAVVFGLFGLVVGSFLNVAILRYGKKSVGGRSACPHCGTQLRWFELVPLLSWIVLRGRCRTCRARISLQYPLVEVATGILFALVGSSGAPLSILVLGLPAVSLLVCIFVYDLYHHLIPDPWVWAFVAFSFLLGFAAAPPESAWWLTLAAGPVAALPLFALWAMSRGRWMGFGDVKLSLGIGWLLAYPYGFIAVMFAFVIGAIISLVVLLPLPFYAQLFGITRLEGASSGFTMKSEVPFGPFLIASMLIIWFALLYGFSIPLFS